MLSMVANCMFHVLNNCLVTEDWKDHGGPERPRETERKAVGSCRKKLSRRSQSSSWWGSKCWLRDKKAILWGILLIKKDVSLVGLVHTICLFADAERYKHVNDGMCQRLQLSCRDAYQEGGKCQYGSWRSKWKGVHEWVEMCKTSAGLLEIETGMALNCWLLKVALLIRKYQLERQIFWFWIAFVSKNFGLVIALVYRSVYLWVQRGWIKYPLFRFVMHVSQSLN